MSGLDSWSWFLSQASFLSLFLSLLRISVMVRWCGLLSVLCRWKWLRQANPANRSVRRSSWSASRPSSSTWTRTRTWPGGCHNRERTDTLQTCLVLISLRRPNSSACKIYLIRCQPCSWVRDGTLRGAQLSENNQQQGGDEDFPTSHPQAFYSLYKGCPCCIICLLNISRKIPLSVCSLPVLFEIQIVVELYHESFRIFFLSFFLGVMQDTVVNWPIIAQSPLCLWSTLDFIIRFLKIFSVVPWV